MSNRAAAAWLAGLVIAAALIAGFVPVDANGVSCGAAFSGGNRDASVAQFGEDIGDAMSGFARDTATDYEADCADRRSTQRTFVIPLLIVGVLVGGFLVLTASRETTAAEKEPQLRDV